MIGTNNLWREAATTFIRRTRIIGQEEPVTILSAKTTNVNGTEIACYAESRNILEGLKRLHVHAVRR